MTETALALNSYIRANLIKEKALKMAEQYPQAFKILPITQGSPEQQGTWGQYQFDGVMCIWINSTHPEAIKFYNSLLIEEREVAMSTDLTTNEKQNIQKFLEANSKIIQNVAPEYLTKARLGNIYFSAILKDPKLGRCTPASLLSAILNAAVLGLEVNTPTNEAYLLPIFNKKIQQHEVELRLDYKGMIKLSLNHPSVSRWDVRAVYEIERDNFDFMYGTNPYIHHKPYTGDKDKGPVIYGYAICFLKDGTYDFEVVDRKTAMEHKARSDAGGSEYSPWNKTIGGVKVDEGSMFAKTAVRILWKRVPKSAENSRAQELLKKVEVDENLNQNIFDADYKIITEEPKEIEKGIDKEPEPEKGKASEKEKETAPEKEKKKTAAKQATKTDVAQTKAPGQDKKLSPIMRQLDALKNQIPDILKKALGNLGIKEDAPVNDDIAKTIMAECRSIADQEAAA